MLSMGTGFGMLHCVGNCACQLFAAFLDWERGTWGERERLPYDFLHHVLRAQTNNNGMLQIDSLHNQSSPDLQFSLTFPILSSPENAHLLVLTSKMKKLLDEAGSLVTSFVRPQTVLSSPHNYLTTIIVVQFLSHVQLFFDPHVVHQAPLSIGFPRQEYWSGSPFPSLGDLPNPGVKPTSLAFTGRFFTTEPPGKPRTVISCLQTANTLSPLRFCCIFL